MDALPGLGRGWGCGWGWGGGAEAAAAAAGKQTDHAQGGPVLPREEANKGRVGAITENSGSGETRLTHEQW